MDGFPPSVPPEVTRLIFLEAVKARGSKRAVRLRLVSRSWNLEATEALLESGMFYDRSMRNPVSPFWPKYLMRQLRQRESLCSRPLRILRKVAQRTVSFRTRTQETDDDTYNRWIEEYLWEICQLYPRCIRVPYWLDAPSLELWPIEPIQDAELEIKQAMLAAAAATNDLALVQELLPSFQDFPGLISQDGEYHDEDYKLQPVLGYPIEIAAFQGHVEILSMLLGTIESPLHLEDARADGILAASRGNQIGTLDLCLKSKHQGYNDTLVNALRTTTSVAVFDRIFPLWKDLLLDDGRSHWKPRSHTENQLLQSEFLTDRFHAAAGQANLDMMKHLVQLGASSRCVYHQDRDSHLPNTRYLRNCVSLAAASGHSEVMAYLLENGAEIGEGTLGAASMHGNADCVRIALDYGASHDDNIICESLIRAVEGEHEEVLRLLLHSFAPLEEELWKQALDVARNEGLLSMAAVLEEHK
ncbi:ankyrin [Apiospora saccharicola]